jgi:hypothetical protein
MTVSDLAALACEDCPAAVTVQRGQGLAGPTLVVWVTHDDDCLWSRAHVPVGGVSLFRPDAILRHTRASDVDVP